MNASETADDALDALLRASTPGRLGEDGFVARTMAAVDVAARGRPAPGRAAAIAMARALAAENRRHAAQTRLWRWAIAGVVAGFGLLAIAMLLAPGGATIAPPSPTDWLALSVLATIGTVWVSWRELRG